MTLPFLLKFHKPNEAPDIWVALPALLSVYRHRGTQVSRFLLPLTCSQQRKHLGFFNRPLVLCLLAPVSSAFSQGPPIIVIILSLLYPPSPSPAGSFWLIFTCHLSLRLTNALRFTKPPLACFTNRRWLCSLSVSPPNHFLHSNLALSPPLSEFSERSLLTFE